jgi:hypothetical protein
MGIIFQKNNFLLQTLILKVLEKYTKSLIRGS